MTRGWGSSTLALESAFYSGALITILQCSGPAENMSKKLLLQVDKVRHRALSMGSTRFRGGGGGEHQESQGQGALHVWGLHHGHCRWRVWDPNCKIIIANSNITLAAALAFSWTLIWDLGERKVATLSKTHHWPHKATSLWAWSKLLDLTTSVGRPMIATTTVWTEGKREKRHCKNQI